MSVRVFPVVGVGKVSVRMDYGLVPVTVRVLCPQGNRKVMRVLMMLIVCVLVAMFHCLMDVHMLVSLG
jgi:hypothetical protein